ncbi:MAG TPA: hypothetical protein VK826_04765 [Bacteroidia bacterium]|nr:hypothetical protein [Bacteroidia bacterium]
MRHFRLLPVLFLLGAGLVFHSGNALTISASDNDEFYCNNPATISGSGQLSGNTLRLTYFWNFFMPNLDDLSANGTAICQ